MKILWIIQGTEGYGERRAIVSLMKGVRISGWEVEVATLEEGECSRRVADEGIKCTCLKLGDSPGLHLARGKAGKLWQALWACRHQIHIAGRIRKAIRASGTDVVHVLNKNILPAVAWAAAREKKMCFWEMTSALGDQYAFDLNRRLHRVLVRTFHIHALANSQYTAQTLDGAHCKADVMYLGVDCQRFNPARSPTVTRASLGIPADAPLFAIVARVERQKGQLPFFEAMLKLPDQSPHLLLVGAHPGSKEAAHINRLARSRAAEHRLHTVDLTDQPETYFALADVAVNARVDAEPFGLSVVEAMMMAKPVLAHALGGPAETILDSRTGWHVPRATIDCFAAGIQRALADHDRWPKMGQAASVRAQELFSLEAQVKRYRSLVMQRQEQK